MSLGWLGLSFSVASGSAVLLQTAPASQLPQPPSIVLTPQRMSMALPLSPFSALPTPLPMGIIHPHPLNPLPWPPPLHPQQQLPGTPRAQPGPAHAHLFSLQRPWTHICSLLPMQSLASSQISFPWEWFSTSQRPGRPPFCASPSNQSPRGWAIGGCPSKTLLSLFLLVLLGCCPGMGWAVVAPATATTALTHLSAYR